MTKQEFENNEKGLAMIISLDPKTGKVIYDTYDWNERDYWTEIFEKDFPEMIHLSTINAVAIRERKVFFGFTE